MTENELQHELQFVAAKAAQRAIATGIAKNPEALAIYHQLVPNHFDRAYTLSDGTVLLVRTTEPLPDRGLVSEWEELLWDDEGVWQEDPKWGAPELEAGETPLADDDSEDEARYEGLLAWMQAEEEWELPSNQEIAVAGTYSSHKALLQDVARELGYRANHQEWLIQNNSHHRKRVLESFRVTPQFIEQVPQLVNALMLWLSGEITLDGSLGSLYDLDAALSQRESLQDSPSSLFPSALAYVGEVIRTALKGEWVLLWNEPCEIWVPYLMDDESALCSLYGAPYGHLHSLSNDELGWTLLRDTMRKWSLIEARLRHGWDLERATS